MKTKSSSYLVVFCFIILLASFYILPLDQRIYSLGDDFVQYLQHAQNICLGHPYTELPYLYNPEALNGPPAYPPVYPLLISPLTCSQTPPYLWIKVISVILFFLSLPFLYKIFRNLSDPSLATETLLLFTILPWVVFWGRDIGSDIPYTFFSILALWFLITLPENRRSTTQAILTGFTMALATLTRDIGLALWGGSVLFYTYKIWRNPPQRSVAVLQFVSLSFAFLIPVFLWNWYQNHLGLGPANKAYFQFSLGLNSLTLPGLMLRVLSNLYYYLQKSYELLFPLSYILRPVPFINWLRLPLAAGLLTILVWQMLKGLKGSALPVILYIGCFLGVLMGLSFPMRAGVRYIIPIAPFLTFFLLKGFKEIFSRHWRIQPYKILLLVWIGLSIWGSTSFIFLIKSPQFSAASPERPAYQTMVSWIQKKLPLNCRIAYIKPRYLSFYSHRPTVVPTLTNTPNQMINQLSSWKVTHVLLDENFLQEESSLRKVIDQYPKLFSPLTSCPPLSLFLFKRPANPTGDIPLLSKGNS